jgi:MFS family permease
MSPRQHLILQSYWFGLSFMWSSLHVIILPAVLLNFVPEDRKNTYLGLLTFAGLVIAMLVQPLAGAFSDRLGAGNHTVAGSRWADRWGRRRPLMLLGTLGDFIFLAFLGYAGGLGWLALGYIGLQFTSNIAHGPAQGLQPDLVPPGQMGAASAVKNLMDMGGLVVASLAMGRLLDPVHAQAGGPVAVVAVVLALAASVTLLGVKEKALEQTGPSESSEKSGTLGTAPLRALVGQAHFKPYAWLIAARFFFLLGIYAIQSFAQYYIRDVLAVENPVKLTGDLLAAITLALIATALLGGWLGDRFGHRKVTYAASLVSALGCLLLLWARTPGLLLAFGAVLGMGIGLFLTSNWALASTLAPVAQAGLYLGLTNIATAGSAAVGRLGGPLIDLLNNAWPGVWAGYTAMFAFGALCALASLLLQWLSTLAPQR